MHSSAKLLLPPRTTLLPTQIQTTSTCSSSPSVGKQCWKLTRRELAICTNSSMLLLFEPLQQIPKARAEENQTELQKNEKASDNCVEEFPTKQAFLEISIDGEPVGRIIIGLNGESAPVGSARFSSLVTGATGISYRRKEFVKIMPNYVQHGGVRSYSVDEDLRRNKARDLAIDSLVDEWQKQNENCRGTKNVAASVGIIVRDPSKPPPKMKLVARQGKLQIDQEEVGKDPNGTEFVISLKDSPELDDSALVIGRVLEGMDVVKRIAEVQTVRENTSSPYFRVAKLIGDKRAVVAERGFNRPYSKILITNCGLMGGPS